MAAQHRSSSHPADASARLEALDPLRSFIVQAPAGSGKTGLLVQRYLTLLAHIQKPEQILAITFTRKAAAEMRNRVLQALRQARQTEAETVADPHLRQIHALATQALQRNAEQGWSLEDNPSRLRIQTIDSLCTALVRQMPLLSRFGAEADIAENPEALYREAAERTVAELETGAGWSPAVETLISYLDNNLERVVALVAGMLAKREQWLRHLAGKEDMRLQRHVLEQGFVRIIEESLQRARRAIEQADWEFILDLVRFAARNLEQSDQVHSLNKLISLDGLPGTEIQDQDAWLALADFLLTAQGTWRKQANKSLGFPAPSSTKEARLKEYYQSRKEDFLSLMEDLSPRTRLMQALHEVRLLPPASYTQNQWIILQSLFEILPLAVAQLEVIFQSENSVDFSEIALRALEALGSPDDPTDLALAWDTRLEHILIDEFQDTSQSQYHLLQLLTTGWSSGDGRTFFAVGDPMQSIYLFREAEVGLFLQTREHGLGHLHLNPLQLQVNFRARQGLVRWVNESFAKVLPEDEDSVSGRVSYTPCLSCEADDQVQRVQIHPLFDSDPCTEAEQVLKIVKQCRREQVAGTIAVLVRSRSHLRELLPALRRQQISFQAVEIEILERRPVVQDLLALTKALLYPGHRPAWLAVLRAPWCGLSLYDLHHLVGADFEKPLIECLFDDSRCAGLSQSGRERVLKVRKILRSGMLQARRSALRDSVETVWLNLGGPACVPDTKDLEDAKVFFDLVSQRFSRGVSFEPSELDQVIRGLFAVPDVQADASLQVMTVHKAKGLEFETVIIPGLGRTWPADAHQLLLWQERPREGGRTDLLLAPMAETGEEQGQAYRYLKGLKKQKSDHEEARVLYVAATRARQALHLLGHVSRDSKTGAMRRPAANSALSCLWPAVGESFHKAFAQASRSLPAQWSEVRPLPEQDQPLKRLSQQWRLPPLPSGIGRSAVTERIHEEGARAVEYGWVGHVLPKIGTLVHFWLHRVAEQGEQGWSLSRISANRELYRLQLRSQGLEAGEAEHGADLVVTALERTLSDPRGRWILSEHDQGRSEYALTGLLEDRPKSVVLDRTFLDSNGVRWIIDFKMSSHEGPDLEAFLNREQGRYQQQMHDYARIMNLTEQRPIKLGLYFPLLQGWREWDFGQ